MAADRIITCTNQDGDSVTFRENSFTPFLLVSADGIYDSKNNIYLMENGLTDGAIYQGENTPYRNIVLTVKDICYPASFYGNADYIVTDATIKGNTLNIINAVSPEEEEIYITSAAIRGNTLEIYNAVPGTRNPESRDFVNHRVLLDKVFKSKEMGRLSFVEYNEERVIDYYVESITSTGTHSSRLHTISLICPDPFFYLPDEQTYVIGDMVPNFKFFHEFLAEGEEFGYYMANYNNIYNESANDNIGITIAMSGKADIINPKFTRMESGEYIQLGTEANPFTVEAGDKLIITTGTGNKHIYLISDGVTTEINYRMTSGSKFIQLMRGDNNIYFDCVSGKKTAFVEISYRMQYARA